MTEPKFYNSYVNISIIPLILKDLRSELLKYYKNYGI